MVESLQQRCGRPPTRAELGQALGVSAQTADFHLRALQRKGHLRLSRLSRGIELLGTRATTARATTARGITARGATGRATTGRATTARGHAAVPGHGAAGERGMDTPRIPLVGRVAAGAPLTAIENLDGDLPLPDGCSADFALRVQGDSMIEAGILDGDLVLVARAEQAERGDIVVAMVGEGDTVEATVKRYLPQRGRVVLRPANSAMSDIVVRPGEAFALAGRVVGVLRLWG